jgi:hypothetical protein
MPLQERVFTLGNIIAGHFSLDYNTTPVQVTNDGESDLTINAGDPLTATGIAENATGLLGLATEFRIIPAGQSDEVMVLDFNYGFGVRLNESMLPNTITAAIKTALIGKGFKFLP